MEEYTFPVVLLEIGRTVEPHVFELGLRSGVEGRQAGYLGAYEVLQSEIGASARLIAALEMLSGEGDGRGWIRISSPAINMQFGACGRGYALDTIYARADWWIGWGRFVGGREPAAQPRVGWDGAQA